ncbi:thioester-containing protein 1 allele S3-like isoform 2-T2 [Cochliomyia hominivorax]
MISCWIKALLVIIYLISTVNSESYYSINAPGIIKSNRKYSVFVAVHEANDPCTLRVGIEGPNFNEFKNISLKPFESQLIEFFPNKLITGDYVLKTEGLSGLDIKNSSRIYAHGYYGPKIYIQTDKAIYKPQDVVRFRIVILDEHTRPFNADEPIRIEILDDEDNRVKQFKDISLTQGVYSNQFKLSKYPILGYWKIKVILGGRYDYSSHETILIRNYVLPKFSVHIKTPSDNVLEDGYLKVVIFGKYTFDKHVEGNATIELWKDNHEKLLETKYVDIENLGFVEFKIKNDKDIRKAYYLQVRASLSEKHTGRIESYVKDVHLHKQRYNLEIPYDEIEFENNMPFRLKVYVKHWTGAAVLDYKTPVIMQHGNKTYEAFLNENGAATFEFAHERNADHIFQFKDSKGQLPNIYTSNNLMLNNKEYYCRLKLLNENLELGKPVQIEVSSIAYIPYLMYIVTGHASIIHTDHIILPPNQRSYVITLTPSIEMIPHSFIYVYYVDNGNLRYEEMTLKFPYEFENQISLSAPKQAKPGQEVTIEINAQPKSYVSILAVDLGVYLLDNSYDLKKSKILLDLDEERSYSPVAATVYPGLLSGLLTLTNANYKFEILNSNPPSQMTSSPS